MASERYRVASSIGDGAIPDFLASSFPKNTKPLTHKYLTKKTYKVPPKDSTLTNQKSISSHAGSEGSSSNKMKKVPGPASDVSDFEKQLNSLEKSSRNPYSYPTETLRKTSGNSSTNVSNPPETDNTTLENSATIPQQNICKKYDDDNNSIDPIDTGSLVSDAASSSKFSFNSDVSSTIAFRGTFKPSATISENTVPLLQHKKVRKPPPTLSIEPLESPPKLKTTNISPGYISPSPHSAPPQIITTRVQDEHLSLATQSVSRKVSPVTQIHSFSDNSDINDPITWTPEMIKGWLHQHQFHEAWSTIIDKYQLYGEEFMKLTSYGEVNKYVTELKELDNTYDELGSSAAARFISLLRKTLSGNSDTGTGSGSNSGSRSGSGSSLFTATNNSSTTTNTTTLTIPTSIRSLDLNSDLETVKTTDYVHLNQPAYSSLISGRSASESIPSSTAKVLNVNHQRVSSLSSVGTQDSTQFLGSLKPNVTNSDQRSTSGSSSLKQRPLSAYELPAAQNFSPTTSTTSSPASRSTGLFKRNNRSADMDMTTNSNPGGSVFKSTFTHSTSSSHLHPTYSNSSTSTYTTPATNISLTLNTSDIQHPSSFHPDHSAKKSGTKDSLFSKWRRHKSKESSGNSIKDILMTTSPISPTVSSSDILHGSSKVKDSNNTSSMKSNITAGTNIVPSFVIDKKYLPTPQSSNSDKYVLLTRDNITFQPINIGSCLTIKDFYSILREKFSLGVQEVFSLHLTEFGFEPGLPLPEDIICTIIGMRFGNISGKILIKFDDPPSMGNDQKDQDGTGTANDTIFSSGNFYDQDSLMSLTNTSASSFEIGSYSSQTGPDGTLVPSDSNLRSHEQAIGYPKTPLHYYEAKQPVVSDGSGTDYMSFKKNVKAPSISETSENSPVQEEERKKQMEEYFKNRAQQEATKMMKLKRTNSKLIRKPPPPPTYVPSEGISPATTIKPRLSSLDTSKSSFRIVRPIDRGEINFDKRRESPFTKSANSSPVNNITTDNKLPVVEGGSPSVVFNKPSLAYKSNTSSEDYKYASLSKLDPVKESTSASGSSTTTPISAISTISNSTLSSNTDTLTMIPVSTSTKSSSSVYSPIHSSTQIPSPATAQEINDDNTVDMFLPLTEPGSLQRSLRVNSIRRFRSIRRGGSTTSASSSMTGTSSTADHRNPMNDFSLQENEISFANAPELPSSSEDEDQEQLDDGNSTTEDFWAQNKNNNESVQNSTNNSDISDLSTLRPGRDVLYENIEQFFPGDVLDRPVIMDQEDENPSCLTMKQKKPPLKRVVSSSFKNDGDDDHHHSEIKPRRTKTIRAVVREARLRESGFQNHSSQNSLSSSAAAENHFNSLTASVSSNVIALNTPAEKLKRQESMALVRRRSTRMWGKSVTEVKNDSSTSSNSNKSNHYDSMTSSSSSTSTNVSKIRRNKNGEIEDYQWVKGKLIGRGTFGEVYLALNVTTGEMIAVKQVKILSLKASTDTGIDALKSEVDTLKDLDHVNVVQYLGFEKTTTEYNLFLEYVAGGSVASCLLTYGRFEEPLVRSITRQVLSGLSYLHSKGILHRDMKADNLLIDLDGVCKITDFGISKKSMGSSVYDNFVGTSMKGTVFWMAPEVVDSQGEGYSAKVDIWSLGCVVLEMFAGKRPWSDYEMVQAMFKIGKDRTPPPIPDETKSYISDCGLDFFKKCWEIDPLKRPTAEVLVRDQFCSENFGEFDFGKTALAALMINSKSKGTGLPN